MGNQAVTEASNDRDQAYSWWIKGEQFKHIEKQEWTGLAPGDIADNLVERSENFEKIKQHRRKELKKQMEEIKKECRMLGIDPYDLL